MKFNLISVGICFALITFVGSCKKSENANYRTKYLGEFNFKVISSSWLLFQPPIKPDT